MKVKILAMKDELLLFLKLHFLPLLIQQKEKLNINKKKEILEQNQLKIDTKKKEELSQRARLDIGNDHSESKYQQNY